MLKNFTMECQYKRSPVCTIMHSFPNDKRKPKLTAYFNQIQSDMRSMKQINIVDSRHLMINITQYNQDDLKVSKS